MVPDAASAGTPEVKDATTGAAPARERDPEEDRLSAAGRARPRTWDARRAATTPSVSPAARAANGGVDSHEVQPATGVAGVTDRLTARDETRAIGGDGREDRRCSPPFGGRHRARGQPRSSNER